MQEIDLIFQQYYRPLCLYATHYLHDIDEAEDVVQDCFVKLISRSIMPENIKAFLYTSVRNACIDRLRRQSPIDTEISPSDLSGKSLIIRRRKVLSGRQNCGRLSSYCQNDAGKSS